MPFKKISGHLIVQFATQIERLQQICMAAILLLLFNFSTYLCSGQNNVLSQRGLFLHYCSCLFKFEIITSLD